MAATAYRETTKPLLRPHQVEKTEAELRRLDDVLRAPPHIASAVNDRADVMRQAKNLRGMIDRQAPQPYAAGEKDSAVKRVRELEGEIQAGMLSHAEMRRNPPGAVDAHRRWERKNKRNIEEYKNIKLRLHATGDDPDRLEDERDVCNLERLRPQGSRMNLDVGQIVPAEHHIPPGATRAENIRNVMTDEERQDEEAQIRALAEKLAASGNEVGIRTLAALRAKDKVEGLPRNAGPGSRTGRKTAWSLRVDYARSLGITFRFGIGKDELERMIAAKEAELTASNGGAPGPQGLDLAAAHEAAKED